MSEDWENLELDLKETAYHRSLLHWSLKSGSALKKKYQAFWKRATAWEKAWSNLAFPGLPADPLVDSESFMVNGHVGWFRENVIWLSPGNQGPVLPVGRWDFEAIVALNNPRPGYYHLADPGPPYNLSYLLMTDIHGGVVGALANRNSDAIERSSVTPYDFWLVTKLVVSLTGTLVGKIAPTITSALPKPTMSNGLRELSSKELGQISKLAKPAFPDLPSGTILTREQMSLIWGGSNAKPLTPNQVEESDRNSPQWRRR
jgi:hypothetical protein